jgi:TolA-binding protein
MFNQGNYADVLKQLRAVLAVKDAPGYDQYDLLTLKGETLLRMKADSDAADSFGDAAKVAKSSEQASLARATEILLRRSHNETYTPKRRDPKSATTMPAAPISVVNSNSRKQAFDALFTDELADRSHDIEAAKKATALPPIASIAPTLTNLHDLEQAGSGKADKTAELSKSVGDRARELMKNAIAQLGLRIDAMEKSANQGQTDAAEHGSHRHNRKRGMSSADVQELHDIAGTCDQIVAACNQIGKALGPDGGDFGSTTQAANEVKKRAEEIAKKNGPKMADNGN